jgi:hypothetical protein
MTNTLPSAVNLLFTLANQAADGLHSLATPIGITQNTETKVRADLTAARAAEGVYQAALATRLTAAASQTDVGQQVRDWLYSARDEFKRTLGRRYSQAWGEVGFHNHTLSLPSKLDGRLELVKSIENYLLAHPSMEVPAASVTHDFANELYGGLAEIMGALAAAWSNQRAKLVIRDAAVHTLRVRLRALINELAGLISPSDPRWLDFGFNIPADNSTPDAPQDLTLSAGSRGHLVADWPRTPRAMRYRVYKQVVGVDPDFVFAKTVTDAEANLNTFTSGTTVKVEVTAVNDTGESLPSAPVQQVVP